MSFKIGQSSNCFIPGCSTGYNSDRKKKKAEGKKVASIFRPPRGYVEIWKEAVGRTDKELSSKSGICELHFTPECIDRFYTTQLFPDGTVFKLARGKPALKVGSIPSIFPNPEPSAKSTFRKRGKAFAVANNPKNVTKYISTDQSPTPIVPENVDRSVLPNQKHLLEASSEKNLSVTVIKEEIDFEDDSLSLNREPTGKNLTPKILENSAMNASINHTNLPDYVEANYPNVNALNSDESHFDVILTNVDTAPTSISDIPVVEAVPPTLKEIAVLTICPSHEQFLNKTAENRTAQEILQCSIEHSVGEENAFDIPIQADRVKGFCFNDLRDHFKEIEMPNQWWGVTSHCDFIGFVKWGDNYTVDRKVIINEKLDVKVFFKDKEVDPMVDVPTSIENISDILKRIDSYGICAGATELVTCLIMLPPLLTAAGRQRYLCDVCRDHRKRKCNQNWYHNTAKKFKKEKIDWRQKFSNERRKNLRYQKKVDHLKRRLEIEKNCTAAALEFMN